MDINDCIIIDVRTREEFMGGHVAGSKNIPLLEILEHEEELKKMKQIMKYLMWVLVLQLM